MGNHAVRTDHQCFTRPWTWETGDGGWKTYSQLRRHVKPVGGTVEPIDLDTGHGNNRMADGARGSQISPWRRGDLCRHELDCALFTMEARPMNGPVHVEAHELDERGDNVPADRHRMQRA